MSMPAIIRQAHRLLSGPGPQPQVPTREDIEKALNHFCTPPLLPIGYGVIESGRFINISGLLKDLEFYTGSQGWSFLPRIYTILRNIQCLQAMQGFIDRRLTDYALPFSEDSLPRAFPDERYRAKFLNFQSCVLTKAIDLEKGEDGKHLWFNGDGDVHFCSRRQLGNGGAGWVDHVYSRLSFKDYARKRFPRKFDVRHRQQDLQKFESEVNNLKRLSYKHLVKYVGSYTDSNFMAVLLEPVADYNLAIYLSLWKPFPPEERVPLRSYFGCLANAVAYLHQEGIRHRDIKSENILVVLQGPHRIKITDFDSSLDWKPKGRSTTSNVMEPGTRYYAAPEMFRGESKRNISADIWSLGVVFLEMTSVLRGFAVQQMRRWLRRNGTKDPEIFHNLTGVFGEGDQGWCEHIRKSPGRSPHDNTPLTWIKDMLEEKPSNRPTATALVKQIVKSHGFTGVCCPYQEAADEDKAFSEGLRSSHLPQAGAAPENPEQKPPVPKGWAPVQESAYSSFKQPFGPSNADPFQQVSIQNLLDSGDADNMTTSRITPTVRFSEAKDYFTPAVPDIVESDEEDDLSTTVTGLHDDKSENEGPKFNLIEDSSDDDQGDESPKGVFRVVEDDSGSDVSSHDPTELSATAVEDRERGRTPQPYGSEKLPMPNGHALPDKGKSSPANETKPDSVSEKANPEAKPPDTAIPKIDDQERTTKPDGMDASSGTSKAQTPRKKPVRQHSKSFSSPQDFLSVPGIVVVDEQGRKDKPSIKTGQVNAGSAGPPRVRSRRWSHTALTTSNLAKLAKETRDPSPERRPGVPSLSPTEYIREAVEKASTAPTSVVSQGTRDRLLARAAGPLPTWVEERRQVLEEHCKEGYVEGVRFLLKSGFNPGTKENPRHRPLFYAIAGASRKHTKCVRALVEHPDIDIDMRHPHSGKGVLHYAIKNPNFRGYTKLIYLLIEAGADVNAKDNNSDTPLLQILRVGYEPLEEHKRHALSLLLQSDLPTNVDVSPPGTRDRPIHLAIRRKDPYAVGMLLTKGAEVNKPNGAGVTPLLLAATSWSASTSKGQAEVLEQLLYNKATVDDCDVSNGKTALHYAAATGRTDIVELLLKYKASPTIKDNQGNTPIREAALIATESPSTSHAKLMKALLKAARIRFPTEKGQCPVVTAMKTGSVRTIFRMWRIGALMPNQSFRALDGKMLHYAARNGMRDMVVLLSKCGAYADSMNDGADAIQMAMDNGHRDIADYLKDEGCFVNTTDVKKPKKSAMKKTRK